jgi:hypothetical protein
VSFKGEPHLPQNFAMTYLLVASILLRTLLQRIVRQRICSFRA